MVICIPKNAGLSDEPSSIKFEKTTFFNARKKAPTIFTLYFTDLIDVMRDNNSDIGKGSISNGIRAVKVRTTGT